MGACAHEYECNQRGALKCCARRWQATMHAIPFLLGSCGLSVPVSDVKQTFMQLTWQRLAISV